MPRGRKKKEALSTKEELAQVVEKITTLEAELKMLRTKKKSLEETVKLEELNELKEIIDASGKSIEEVKELLK